MTNTKPVAVFGALLCSSLLWVLTGCAASDTTDADRADFAGAQKEMEHILPLLQDSAGTAGLELPLVDLAESTCRGPKEDQPQKETRWVGFLQAAAPDQAQTQAALDAVAATLGAEGWTLGEDVREPADDPDLGRYIVYRKAGIVINASHRLGPSDSVAIFADTRCIDHPSDHQMVRSTLDPSYGKSSGYYADDDE